MRMEFSRMTGVFISQRAWAVDGKSTDELVTDAKRALSGFYDGDEYAFWPKEEYASNTPEHVRLVDFDRRDRRRIRPGRIGRRVETLTDRRKKRVASLRRGGGRPASQGGSPRAPPRCCVRWGYLAISAAATLAGFVAGPGQIGRAATSSPRAPGGASLASE